MKGTLFAGHTAEWGEQQKEDYDASGTTVPPTNIGPIWISAPMPDWLSSGSY
jgi:hypothetical protein